MATQDLFRVELYYQHTEEVLGLNFHYMEGAEAPDVSGCRELAQGFIAKFETLDLFNYLAVETRFYGVRVVCISDSDHNTHEEQTAVRGTDSGVALPDMQTVLLVFTGEAPDGIPTFSRLQASWICDTWNGGNILSPGTSTLLRDAWWPEMQVLDGPNVGQWIAAIPHEPSPGLPIVPVPALEFGVNPNTGSRYDRKPNTPNTGRKKPELTESARVKKKRRSRAERAKAYQEAGLVSPVNTTIKAFWDKAGGKPTTSE